MLTKAQIEAFVELVDAEANLGICDEDVIATTDTVADFIVKFGNPCEVSEGLNIWIGVQSAKGQKRKDICLFDFGDVRAVSAL